MPDTRERMVEIGADLLRRQGYHATTLVQVVKEGGLPRGSIYHHFPGGKPQLVMETIAVAAREVTDDMASALDGAERAGDAIERYVTILADRLESSGYEDGCWYATTALEVAPDETQLADALAEQFRTWMALIAAGLVGFGKTEDVAMSDAELLVATVEGGLLLARVSRDATILRNLIPRLRAIVDPD